MCVRDVRVREGWVDVHEACMGVCEGWVDVHEACMGVCEGCGKT